MDAERGRREIETVLRRRGARIVRLARVLHDLDHEAAHVGRHEHRAAARLGIEDRLAVRVRRDLARLVGFPPARYLGELPLDLTRPNVRLQQRLEARAIDLPAVPVVHRPRIAPDAPAPDLARVRPAERGTERPALGVDHERPQRNPPPVPHARILGHRRKALTDRQVGVAHVFRVAVPRTARGRLELEERASEPRERRAGLPAVVDRLATKVEQPRRRERRSALHGHHGRPAARRVSEGRGHVRGHTAALLARHDPEQRGRAIFL